MQGQAVSQGNKAEAERAQQASAPADDARAGLPRHLAADALRRRMLAAADALALLLACAALVTTGAAPLAAALWAASLAPAWIVVAKLHGLYDRDHRALRHLTVDEFGSIVAWSTVSSAITAAFVALTPESLSAGAAIQLWLVVTILAPVLRAAARLLWRSWTPLTAVLLVGSGPLERATRRKLELFGDIHMRVAGVIDVDRMGTPEGGAPLDQQMRDACGGTLPERVIVCTENVRESVLADVVSACRKSRIKLSMVPPLRGAFGTAVRLSHVAELPFVEYHTGDASMSTVALKRFADVLGASVALVVTAPILLATMLAIRLDSRGPVFYVQRRAGVGGEPFRMLKFRTMVEGAHERLGDHVQIDTLPDPMFKLQDDPRVTRVGRVLRRWSLDELPQLVNVLRGDMSLVGPRPEAVEMVERYRPEHRFRLEARPGMTGPMQVFGRGHLGFDERLAVEREYIENLSLGRDLRILLMTIPAVLSGRGAF